MLKKLGSRAAPGGVGAVLGGCPAEASRGPPENEMESDGAEEPGRTITCHECGRIWEKDARAG